ncbi:MAG: glycosyltransferase [Verrucomicrobiota bacterium]|nr:glycosyltransferase [Verrucomicrobiota bacterium]
MAAGGVFRALKFVKYLKQHGWEPTVLTAKPIGAWVTDKSLLDEIDCEVHYTKSFHPVGLYRSFKDRFPKCPSLIINILCFFLEYLPDLLMVPDTRVGWVPFAILKGLRLHKSKKFDVILTNSPPHSTHFAGIALSKLTGLPWVTDFKDGWIVDPFRKKRGFLREMLERNLERKILTNCTNVISVTEPLVKYFQQLTHRQVSLIPNGFDEDDFTPTKNKHKSKFVIGYFGAIFGDRDPSPFLLSLESFCSNFKPQKTVKVIFIGPIVSDVLSKIRSFENFEIETKKYIPHRECIKLMQTCDVLLTLVGSDKRNNGVLTGKIFEYLRCGLPILALCPVDGALWKFLNKFNRIYKCSPNNTDQIEKEIEKAYKDIRAVDSGKTSKMLSIYNRKNLTGQLAIHLTQSLK